MGFSEWKKTHKVAAPWLDEDVFADLHNNTVAIREALARNKRVVDLEPFPYKITRLLLSMIVSDYPIRYDVIPSRCILRRDPFNYVHRIEIVSSLDFSSIELFDHMIDRRIKHISQELDIKNHRSSLAKERAVHDWIVQRTAWDDRFAKDDLKYISNHNLVGVLLTGKGVCASVAATANVLLNTFGVECHTVCGYTKNPPTKMVEHDTSYYCKSDYTSQESPYSNCKCINLPPLPLAEGSVEIVIPQGDGYPIPHAWNYVVIDRKRYYLDITYDYHKGYDCFNVESMDDRMNDEERLKELL